METFEINMSLALSAATVIVLSAEHIDVEERLSSASATPIPGPLARFDTTATEAPSVVDDASAVVRAAAKTVERLAFLPTDPKDEALVDALVARKMAPKKLEPLE